MLNKEIKFDTEARVAIKNGMDKVADAVKSTLGPQGRCVVIGDWDNGLPHVTKDGVTVAKSIQLSNNFENIGCHLIREASLKSADICGDGTTSTVVLTQAFCQQIEEDIANYKVNIPEYASGMEIATMETIDKIKKESIEVDNDSICYVATTSANNNEFIGNLIGDVYKKIGKDGIITVDYSKNTETTVEIISGMRFENGFLAPHFVTDERKNQCVLENPYIFISDQKILRTKDIVNVLEPIAKNGQSVLLLAEEFDSEVLENLKLNKLQGILKCCAVKAPSFGDYRKEVLEDIAVLTNGTAVTYDSGIEVYDTTFEMLGKAQKVVVTKDDCTIIGGSGSKDKIDERVAIIKSLQKQELESSDPSDFLKKFYADRIAKLVGGIAVIHVGGVTESEMKERKDRIDDAVCAVKAAIDGGTVIGGGMSFYNAMLAIKTKEATTSKQLGYNCVVKNLNAIVKQIMENAGFDYTELSPKFTKNKGFNASTLKIENLRNAGVINPYKCDKISLENAVSVATTFLKLGCVVANEPINQLVI